MQKIGEHLAELRKKKQYKQTELAEKLNVSQQVISNIERGVSAPDIELLKKNCGYIQYFAGPAGG